MDDLLQPVKTVRHVKTNIAKFENLALKEHESTKSPVRGQKGGVNNGTSNSPSTPLSSEKGERALESQQSFEDTISLVARGQEPGESTGDQDVSSIERPTLVSSPEDALRILRAQPSGDQFENVIEYLLQGIQDQGDFNIQTASPVASQLLNVFTTTVISDRWSILTSPDSSKADKYLAQSILRCMTSSSGLGALTARLRSLLDSPQIRKNGSSPFLAFEATVSFATRLFQQQGFFAHLLAQVQTSRDPSRKLLALWNETIALLAGSKMLNVFQEAATLPELNDTIPQLFREPDEYGRWLGGSIALAAIDVSAADNKTWSLLASFFSRALSLVHKDVVISEMYGKLLFGKKALWTPLRLLSNHLPRLHQKMVLEVMLNDASKNFLAFHHTGNGEAELSGQVSKTVGGVAAMMAGFIYDNDYLEEQLVEWLSSTSSPFAGTSLETCRAAILFLSAKEGRAICSRFFLTKITDEHIDKLRTLLEKGMTRFSDKLHIRHDSLLQQESLAQVILLTAGYLHRIKSSYMIELSKSSPYLHAVSNRLAASLPRARFLGMVVGMAISRLVDAPDKAMKFDVDELELAECEWWYELARTEDTIGSVEDLSHSFPTRTHQDAQTQLRTKKPAESSSQHRKRDALPSKIVSIEEIDDDEDDQKDGSEEEDLIPYQKPDEDPEDSEEDPTLIRRDKPRAPVYVRELIKGLNTTDKLEVMEISLKTAPSLIRRKANFGAELSQDIETLTRSLINLQEGMSDSQMQELRLQSLIACLVSRPSTVGPWLARIFFEGDLSLYQRGTILTTIGLGAREIAGQKDEDDEDRETQDGESSQLLPSKQLPSHLDALYGPLNKATTQIQQKTLRPMALAAADEATGPAVLKIRTFSSRLEVEKKTKARTEARTKRVPKDLHRILAESLYLPLCCRMSILLSNPSSHITAPTLYEQYQHLKPQLPHKQQRSTSLLSSSSAAATFSSPASILDPSTLKLQLQTLTVVLTTLGPNSTHTLTISRETILLLTILSHRSYHLALDPAVLPALLTLFLALLDIIVAGGTTTEEMLVTDLGAEVSEVVEWVSGLISQDSAGEGGGGGGRLRQGGGRDGKSAVGGITRIPEVERSSRGTSSGGDGGYDTNSTGLMPWTVVAAGIMVKWSEISRKFQARLMGMVGGGGAG